MPEAPPPSPAETHVTRVAKDKDVTVLLQEGYAEVAKLIAKLGSASEGTPRSINIKPKISNSGKFDRAGVFWQIFAHYPEVEALSIGGIDLSIDDGCVEQIADFIAKNLNLLHISITECKLTDAGFTKLAEALAKHSILIDLDLSANQLTKVSAEKLLDMQKADKPFVVDLRLDRAILVNIDGSRVFVKNDVSAEQIVALQEESALDLKRLNDALNNRNDPSKLVPPLLARIMKDPHAWDITRAVSLHGAASVTQL